MAKIIQNTPQKPPSRPPKNPKCGQNVVALFDFTLRPFFSKSLQVHPKSYPKSLKMAILAPTWGILAPSWFQLGPILAQFGEISADPSPAQIDQNLSGQLLRDFSSPGRPQELPDPLQTAIFQVFGNIFKTFSLISLGVGFSSWWVYFVTVFINIARHLF